MCGADNKFNLINGILGFWWRRIRLQQLFHKDGLQACWKATTMTICWCQENGYAKLDAVTMSQQATEGTVVATAKKPSPQEDSLIPFLSH